MSDTMPPEYNPGEILSEMVDEETIVSGSRPFIKLHLKGVPPNDNENVLQKFFDADISFLNGASTYENSDWPRGSYTALLGRDIVEADFDAETLGTRRGTINITDPLGIWPEIIAKVSAHADRAGRGLPNIEVLFGWMDLNKYNGSEDKIQSVYGIITKTNFSLGENGVMSLTIHFVESAMDMLSNLKFLKFDDMLTVDPDSDESEIEEKLAPHAAINAIINNSSLKNKVKTSETNGDDGQSLTLIMDETDAGHKNKVKMKDYTVRFGDSFYDKLQSIVSKAKPPANISVLGEGDPVEVNEDENDYSYQIIRKKTYVPESEPDKIKSIIRYGWNVVPKEAEETGEQSGDQMFPGAFRIGNLSWKKVPNDMGGYRTGTGTARSEVNKTALSVDIDLRSFTHLHALVQNRMNKYLNKLDDKSWERIEENLGDIERDPNADFTPDEVVESMERDSNWFKDMFRNWGENEEDFEIRREAVVHLSDMQLDADESEDEVGTPASSQIRALIRQFSFQMKVTILGDPAFGTYLEPARGYFNSDFSGLGRFAGYFDGLKWLVMKATHKFSNDGTYKTELELRSTPPDARQGGDSDTGEDTFGGSYPDTEDSVDWRGMGS